MNRRRTLDSKQDEQRLRGLRILARMILRAHLDSRGVDGAKGADGCIGAPADPGTENSRRDGENVR